MAWKRFKEISIALSSMSTGIFNCCSKIFDNHNLLKKQNVRTHDYTKDGYCVIKICYGIGNY